MGLEAVPSAVAGYLEAARRYPVIARASEERLIARMDADPAIPALIRSSHLEFVAVSMLKMARTDDLLAAIESGNQMMFRILEDQPSPPAAILRFAQLVYEEYS